MSTIGRQISTIAQFRVMDYGMEKCSLAFHLPDSPTPYLDPIISTTSGEDAIVDVWLLSPNGPLDPRSLTWSSKPTARLHLGTLSIAHNRATSLPPLPCTSNSFQAYQLTCVSDGCLVDVGSIDHEIFGEPLLPDID